MANMGCPCPHEVACERSVALRRGRDSRRHGRQSRRRAPYAVQPPAFETQEAAAWTLDKHAVRTALREAAEVQE